MDSGVLGIPEQMRRLTSILWFTLAFLGGQTAVAHPLLQNTWWVTIETNRIAMRVSSTLREISVTCGPAFSEHLPTSLEGWHP